MIKWKGIHVCRSRKVRITNHTMTILSQQPRSITHTHKRTQINTNTQRQLAHPCSMQPILIFQNEWKKILLPHSSHLSLDSIHAIQYSNWFWFYFRVVVFGFLSQFFFLLSACVSLCRLPCQHIFSAHQVLHWLKNKLHDSIYQFNFDLKLWQKLNSSFTHAKNYVSIQSR